MELKRRAEKQAVPTIAMPIKNQCATLVSCTDGKGYAIMGSWWCNFIGPMRHKPLQSRLHRS